MRCPFGIIQNLFHMRRGQPAQPTRRRRNQIALRRLTLTVWWRHQKTSRPRGGPRGKTSRPRPLVHEGEGAAPDKKPPPGGRGLPGNCTLLPPPRRPRRATLGTLL